MSLAVENERLRSLRPFVVATPENLAQFELAPFGIEIDPGHRFDPLRRTSVPFLGLLERLDASTFGPEGMPMPRWVFFDGAELPGGIVGFGLDASELDRDGRARLGVSPDYKGLVPVSMFIAIPSYEPASWVAHNLASANAVLPEQRLSGLGGYTKAAGLVVLRAKQQIGATQWNSMALFVHTRMGPLDLLTAWTPAHGEPWTLTYQVALSEQKLRNLARDPGGAIECPAAEQWVDSEDHDAQKALQQQIEAGRRFQIVGRPQVRAAGRLLVPIRGL